MPKANFINDSPSLFDRDVAQQMERWQDQYGSMAMLLIWSEGGRLGIVANGGDGKAVQIKLVAAALHAMMTDASFGK